MFVGRRDGQARPTVILIPTVMGVSDLEIGFGRQLVELGYNAFVADLFGKEFRGAPRDTMFGEMNRLQQRPRGASPPAAARARAGARPRRGRRTVRSSSPAIASAACARSISPAAARKLPRRSASTACSTRPACRREKIKAKVVAFHGWDDPMVPPEKVVALGQELTEAGSDWQIHAYGHVGHGFTNPHASTLQIDGVAYNALAAERSWTSFINLLEELFGHAWLKSS